MKILIVGSAKPFAIEASYKKHLGKWAEVNLFEAHDLFLEYYTKSVFNKLVYRLGFSSILQRINKKLLVEVSEKKPDLVWVFKGMEINPRTLVKLKQEGVLLANYNADHPFLFAHRGSGNKNVLDSIVLYDHHFTYSLKIQRELISRYKVNTSWLPFAYDTAKENLNSEPIKRVCFIGNPEENRVQAIEFLLQNDLPVTIFGHNWDKYFNNNHSLLEVFPPVYKEEYIIQAQRYALQLNLLREQNYASHNMRTFETPAIGCIMLAPDTEEHQLFFEDNQEAIYFKDKVDMIKKAKAVLKLDKLNLQQLQKKAYLKSIKSAYNYSDRADEVYKVFEDLAGCN